MQVKPLVKALMVGMPLVWLAACSSTPEEKPPVEQTAPTTTETGNGADTSAQGNGSGLTAEEQQLIGTRVIYFDFDQSTIRQEFAAVLAAHGKNLAANPSTKVTLEGHADERGSQEYNVALGERRAQSVARVLMSYGVAQSQIDIVSYGEERAAVNGHSEEAWSQNRRVEIKY